jgi:hypothetical protein
VRALAMWLLFPESSPHGDPSAEHHAVPGEKPVVAVRSPDSNLPQIRERNLKRPSGVLQRCRRRQHGKGFFVHLKVNRAIPG